MEGMTSCLFLSFSTSGENYEICTIVCGPYGIF